MAAGGHFGWPKITFERISRHFRSICTVDFLFTQNGCQRSFWIIENRFRLHFSPFQINTQLLFVSIFFTKWQPAAILDGRKSLSIAFLALSYQYATFIFVIFFSQNGCRRPFWKSDLGHFGWPKITFDHISRHFRSIHNFLFFFKNGRRRPFWMSDLGQKTIGFFHYVLSMAMPNMKLIS